MAMCGSTCVFCFAFGSALDDVYLDPNSLNLSQNIDLLSLVFLITHIHLNISLRTHTHIAHVTRLLSTATWPSFTARTSRGAHALRLSEYVLLWTMFYRLSFLMIEIV
eukprot:64919_1